MPRRDPFGTREGSGAIHRTIYKSRVNSATTFYAFNLRTSASKFLCFSWCPLRLGVLVVKFFYSCLQFLYILVYPPHFDNLTF